MQDCDVSRSEELCRIRGHCRRTGYDDLGNPGWQCFHNAGRQRGIGRTAKGDRSVTLAVLPQLPDPDDGALHHELRCGPGVLHTTNPGDIGPSGGRHFRRRNVGFRLRRPAVTDIDQYRTNSAYLVDAASQEQGFRCFGIQRTEYDDGLRRRDVHCLVALPSRNLEFFGIDLRLCRGRDSAGR